MKKLTVSFIVMVFINICHAQQWQDSGDCHHNANDFSLANFNRNNAISSTVKLKLTQFGSDEVFDFSNLCSGTLINRNTNDNEVGFFVLTANHCLDETDFNAEHIVYFNYQSPDEDDSTIQISNRGIINAQSLFLTDNGYQYYHKTHLRLVNRFVWGDLALIEILTPVPPHFNVTYAGWNPSKFYNGLEFGITNPFQLPTKYVGVHHPQGDIKKINGINYIGWLETPIATGCYTITTIIDVLFGWIWSNSVSTSVICKYVDNPWLHIQIFQYGITEDGSSGSGIFNQDNQLIGVLSGGLGSCSVPIQKSYGKLHANYSNASIKNVLNPDNDVWVDLFGMRSRKIKCYDELTLPGAPGVSGQYFPANHYQSQNRIVLQSLSDITIVDDITIHSGADYILKANDNVEIEGNLIVDPNADFAIEVGNPNCFDTNRATVSATEQMVIDRLKQIHLPEEQIFDIGKYIN